LVVPNSQSAFEHRSDEFLDEAEAEYNLLDDRFILSGLEIYGRSYLQRSFDTIAPDVPKFVYPSVERPVCDEEIEIICGPDIINGHENDSKQLYKFGVLTNMHNHIALSYLWFLNNQPVCSGPRQYLLKPAEPGSSLPIIPSAYCNFIPSLRSTV